MTISRYVLVDENDVEGDFEYESFADAKKDAGTTNAVIERTYEYSDSELAWTPNGADVWPPVHLTILDGSNVACGAEEPPKTTAEINDVTCPACIEEHETAIDGERVTVGESR